MFAIPLVMALICGTSGIHEDILLDSDNLQALYLRGAQGQLDYYSPVDTCELYFHVPIAYGSQVPLLLTVEAPHLIDYRFMKTGASNVLCVARMAPGTGILDWVSYALVERNLWSDIPPYVEIPQPEELPDSVKGWLKSTDCCQLDAPSVAEAVIETGEGITNVIDLAESIEYYVAAIPGGFPHSPMAFDAQYAIQWGNSCTGHAHAAAALFRGNGIPARALLNIPSVYGTSYWFDQHWIVDYYIPDYGWVMAETGLPRARPRDYLITYVVEPHQEFPKWYSNSIDGLWHSSSPWIPMPDWGQAHIGIQVGQYGHDEDLIDQAMSVCSELWDLHTTCTGLILDPLEAQHRADAVSAAEQAYEAIEEHDIESCIAYAQTAVSHYQAINLSENEVFFSEDFEEDSQGLPWTHGGTEDTWEQGSPSSGPESAYSGSYCWGTGLNGNYSCNCDCWLISPVVDLDNRSNAELSFWLWNDIEDLGWSEPDMFFVEVLRLEENRIIPLSGCIKGVNNDPEIVGNGGWTRVTFDLRRYIGESVRFRFRLISDEENSFPGAYIDNVEVSGRYKDLTGISREEDGGSVSVSCTPNPCLNRTSIMINLPADEVLSVAVYDLAGRMVAEPLPEFTGAGQSILEWNCRDAGGRELPGGVYFIRVNAPCAATTGKLVILSP